MSQFGYESKLKIAEDEADVRYIIKELKADGYTIHRLNQLLENEKIYVEWEKRKGFQCRMSLNVIKAIEQMLSNPELL